MRRNGKSPAQDEAPAGPSLEPHRSITVALALPYVMSNGAQFQLTGWGATQAEAETFLQLELDKLEAAVAAGRAHLEELSERG